MGIRELLDRVEPDFGRFETRQGAREKFMPLLEMLGRIDEQTLEHSIRVAYLGVDIAAFTHLAPQKTLWLPGLVHDIGKIKVPLEILRKTEGFNRNDEEIMRIHVKEGCRMLLGIADFSAFVLFYHHFFKTEDAYPNEEDFSGIFGDHFADWRKSTKLLAEYCGRLLSVADFYDAITTRPNDKYSPGKPRLATSEEARERLLAECKDQSHLISCLYDEGIFR